MAPKKIGVRKDLKRTGLAASSDKDIEKKTKVAQEKLKLKHQLSRGGINQVLAKVLPRLDGNPDELVLHGVEKTKADLLSNLNCAIKDYRGNSTILIGPRASGKSTLLHQITSLISRENGCCEIEKITLQGSIFPETQSVLRFLLAKMRQMASGTDSIEAIDFSNSTVTEEEISEFVAFDQFSALLRQYLTAKASMKSRYLVFILEDLDKFAAHPQQNLLYTLFELTLSLPIYIFGVSCRIDVLELLEKRVKSRFSQNIVYLPMPETWEDFQNRIKANLLISDVDDLNPFNSAIEEFMTESEDLKELTTFYFDLAKDVRPVFRFLTVAFSSLKDKESFYFSQFAELFESVVKSSSQTSSLISEVLNTTTVELMVLVATCRLSTKFPSTPVTLGVIQEELNSCKARAAKLEHFNWSKAALHVAFDRLLNCRLLLPATASSASWLDRSYLTVRLGFPQFLIIEAIEKHPQESKEIFALANERF